MILVKKIDVGDYIVVINYDDSGTYIKVSVLDELEEEIEHIEISDDEGEEKEDDNDDIKPILN